MPDAPPPPGPAARLAARYGAPHPASAPWSDAIDIMLAHASVRAYRDAPLPQGTLETLFAAAQSAATSSNLQAWSVVAVEDPARRARLATLAAGQAQIRQAPLFLAFLADLSRVGRVAGALGMSLEGLPFLETFLVAVIDAALAAQNAAIAAESLGLCYIGALRNRPEEVAAELALPASVFAVFGLCVGHPDPASSASVKPRLPQAAALYREQYDATAEPASIAAYDARLTAFQVSQGMAATGWSQLVANRLRTPQSLTGRDRLAEALHKLGFGLR